MLAPKPAYFWDDTTNSWRKAVVGEAGEYVWNNTTNAWEFGTIGAEYLYNHSTKAWDFGPGGQYVYNHSTKSWDKVTSPGYGGQYYWDTTTNSWTRNANAASASDAFARWDFLTNQAWWDGAYVGALANTPNWTFTRASTAYYRNSSGVLVPFASGALRTGDRGALIEGARTNLCLQSQTFDNVSWSKTRASVSANAAVAPDGTTTADTLVEDTSATTTHYLTSSAITITADSTITVSIYAKASTRSWIRLQGSDNTESNLFGTHFNLSTGAIGTTVTGGASSLTSANISALGNGWYRCVVTGVIGAGSTIARVGCKMANADNSSSYTGDGVSGLYLWGAQVEAASFPSSYIPTTTASATRAADSLTVTGVTGLDYPLTLYAEFERGVDTGAAARLISTNTGSFNERAWLEISATDTASGQSVAGGVGDGNSGVAGSVAVGAPVRIAARFALNSVRSCRDGTLGTDDTSAAVAATPNRINIGHLLDTTHCYGYLRRAAIYASAKTDAQLQAMTT